MVAAGEFPSPIKLSTGNPRWRQSDVDTWLDQRREK
jgi:predicted DNA-binding transcriptional regulator AlpA